MHFPLSTRMRRSKREEHGTVNDQIKKDTTVGEKIHCSFQIKKKN